VARPAARPAAKLAAAGDAPANAQEASLARQLREKDAELAKERDQREAMAAELAELKKMMLQAGIRLEPKVNAEPLPEVPDEEERQKQEDLARGLVPKEDAVDAVAEAIEAKDAEIEKLKMTAAQQLRERDAEVARERELREALAAELAALKQKMLEDQELLGEVNVTEVRALRQRESKMLKEREGMLAKMAAMDVKITTQQARIKEFINSTMARSKYGKARPFSNGSIVTWKDVRNMLNQTITLNAMKPFGTESVDEVINATLKELHASDDDNVTMSNKTLDELVISLAKDHLRSYWCWNKGLLAWEDCSQVPGQARSHEHHRFWR
jgi:hypothetical protein